MFTNEVDVITTPETWLSKNYWPVDPDDNTIIDMTVDGLVVDIIVTIKPLLRGDRFDYGVINSNCALATATASLSSGVVTGGNGKVVVSDVGFQWQFEVSDLANLCAGTYGLVAKVTINGFVQDVIDGTIAVLQGS